MRDTGCVIHGGAPDAMPLRGRSGQAGGEFGIGRMRFPVLEEEHDRPRISLRSP